MIEHKVWSHVIEEKPSTVSVCSGEAFGFSRRSAGKEGPNEDAAGLFVVSDDSAVFAVADGVGGANSGDRAAICVIESLRKQLDTVTEPGMLRPAVLDGIEAANNEIVGWGIGAATTLAVVIYSAGTIRPLHIGDAMVLLCSNHGKVRYTTVAHGPVAMAMELGIIDETEAMQHEDRNLISNCVGSREMRIEIGPEQKMGKRDTLLISSDGVFDNLWQEEIVNLIRRGKLESQMLELVALTSERMQGLNPEQPCKPDDATLICFRQC